MLRRLLAATWGPSPTCSTPSITFIRSFASRSSVSSHHPSSSATSHSPSHSHPSAFNSPPSHTRGIPPRLVASQLRALSAFIVDMDGVLYHLQRVLPGAMDFISWLQKSNKKFLFLTNSSERSPKELSEKLKRMGIEVSPNHFYTSALATAQFLSRQKPNGSAYVIGEPGLFSALYDVGYSMNDSNPDFVVVGETRNYNYATIETAAHLVRKGARLIGTNCDIADKVSESFIPACGSLVKPIELVSGREAYFVGKPNPLIMRAALGKLGVTRSQAAIVGDRMDTDILAGIQSEINTVMVLTGVTSMTDLSRFAYRPDCILPSAGHLLTDNNEVWENPYNPSSSSPMPAH